jgi:hypothetical protein
MLRKKAQGGWKECPQRLKPDLFASTHLRAEARTLQQRGEAVPFTNWGEARTFQEPEFFAVC